MDVESPAVSRLVGVLSRWQKTNASVEETVLQVSKIVNEALKKSAEANPIKREASESFMDNL